MQTYLRFLLGPAVMAGVAFFLLAQDAVKEPATGKVLLLKNGSVLEGDIAQVGTQMCIRRGASEVWIDASKASRLCADWDDAYVHMQTLLKLDSAAERVKFARWCHLYHLNEKALEQARKAMELQPNHRDAKQLVSMLERSLKETPSKPNVPMASTPRTAPAPSIDVTAETLVSFTARVQPILMNTCVSCHGTGFVGKFRLERTSEGGYQIATRNNLNAALGYFDLDRPTQSLLLVKAIEAHGNTPLPPIKDRGAAPFQTMQSWIEQTIACNPQLKKQAPAEKSAKAEASPAPIVVSRSIPRIEVVAETKRPTEEPSRVLPAKASQIPILQMYQSVKQDPPRASSNATSPRTSAPEREWCDPEIFNEMSRSKTPANSVGR